jgi:putative ABC transport system permease protein
MTFGSRVRSWIRVTVFRARAENEMDAEMRFHVDAYAADLIRDGVSPEEAMRRAQAEFGGIQKAKENCRDARGVNIVESFFQDLRYGARSMWRAPGFTAVAVIALALGIGANAAVFSVVNAVLLRPLAYKDSKQLVTILHRGTDPVAPANYIDWRDQSRSFETMSAADYWTPNLTNSDPPEHLWALKVTQSTFPMLGVAPFLGRWFAVGEDLKGAEHEVILGYRLWQRRFGSDPNILGRTITLDGEAYAIVGVMPADFKFAPFWATRAELWAPNVLADRVATRGGNSLRVFARLKPGVTIAQAQAELSAIAARLEKQFPGTNREVTVTRLREKVVGRIETSMLVFLGAVGFVLLIACANVAHMLLARTAARQKEIAVRTALGAGRLRLVRQFLTENLLLAAIGGSIGLLLAVWGTRALVALSPPEIPRLDTVSIDARVILFLIGISALTSVCFGLAPAMHASAVNLSDSLKESGRGTSDGMRRNRFRNFLVISEFALALMLLIGAGLMIRSFVALQSIDPGFNPHNVLSMVVSVAGSKEAEPGQRAIFYQQLLNRVRALPGVESAGGINHFPIIGDLWGWSFAIEGRPKPLPGESPSGTYRIITPGYLDSVKLPLLRGRDITAADDAPAPGVVIINERAAARYWPGEDPIGKHVTFDEDKDKKPIWLTVIGIVKNAKQEELKEKPSPEVYLAAFQNHDYLESPESHLAYITLVVRTSGDPGALATPVKNVVWSFDHNLPISEVVTMDEVVAATTAEPRFETLLLGIFAGVALALAAVGIYGVMSYTVTRRTHEIGIRVSLGASRSNILMLVVKQGMLLALIGSSVGVGCALLLSRLMTKLLYGVHPNDPLTFGAVAAILITVAFAASYIPARRAMRVDPMVALRHE